MRVDDWWGLYGGSLKDWLVPAAFSHPAKFSKKLIERIYAHALAEGWLVPGSSTVLDPMAGVATGGVAAANAGLAWEGIELEGHFIQAGQATLERHRAVWERMGRPVPVLRQGDARHLDAAIGTVPVVVSAPREGYAAVVSSPPYADAINAHGDGIDWSKADPATTGNRKRGPGTKHFDTLHAQHSYRAVVTSPPFSPDQPRAYQHGHDLTQPPRARGATEVTLSTPGQLGALPMGDVRAVISSPSPLSGDTYWVAMRQVCENCYAVLPAGGHIILTLKGFVRKGQYVDLPGQTCQLLEAVGFTVLHRHRAWLLAKEAQARFDGGEDRCQHKSFFRRIQERRGAPAVDFEEVLCAVKGAPDAGDRPD